MARRVLVASVASLALASAGASPCAPLANPTTTNLATTEKTVLDETSFKDATDPTSPFVSCVSNERMQITSVAATETSGTPVDINVNVVYKKPSATNQLSVDYLSGQTCYDSPAVLDLAFDPYAVANPDKTVAIVEIDCPSAGSAACNVDYQVTAKCVASSPECPTIGTGITAGATIAINAKSKLLAVSFKDAANNANAAPTCTAAQRLDITSVVVSEKTGGVIKVDTGYQTTTSTNPIVVDTFATGSCYQPSPSATALSTARANGNPDTTVPYVEITCLSSNAADCSVDYLVQAQCVDKSICPVLSTTAAPVSKGAVKTVLLSEMVDTTAAAAPNCAANYRFDITSVSIVEANGASLTASVQYQKDGSSSLEVKPFSGASCYSGAEADVSFAPKAATNPEKVNPVVAITCPSTNSADCSVKFSVQGKCVAYSATCPAITPLYYAAVDQVNDQKLTPGTFRDAANSANPVPVCTSTQRLDITSVQVTERDGAVLNVETGYRKQDGSSPIVVDSMMAGSCYQPATTATTLSVAKANENADNTEPYVGITCAASNTNNCNVNYLVLAKCVDKSTCPTLTSSPVPVAAGTTKSVPVTEVVDLSGQVITSCAGRIDVTTVSVVEANNAPLTASVKYTSTDASISLEAKSFTGATCYKGLEADVSFAARAQMNPDLVTPAVSITCPSTNTAACSVQYKVVGKCVDKSVAVTLPTTAVAFSPLAAGETKSVPLTDFKTASGVATALTCTDPTQRMDIKSAIVSETNKANIKIDAGYQNNTTSRVSVFTVPSGVQYATTGAELKFGVKADGNADKTDSYFDITCLAPNAAGCSLKYEVVGECVARTTCPALPGTPNTLSIAKTVDGNGFSTAVIPVANIVDATTGAALTDGCTAANTRLDIVSATFAEANGIPIKADVSYRRDAVGAVTAKSLSVKSSTTDTACFAYKEADVSFALFADANPDKLAPVITLTCPSTAVDCSVKYNVVGKCVPVSTSCSTLTSSTAKTITKNTANFVVPTAEITAAAGAALACKSTERVDITSAKISEQSGASINVKVGYQNAAATTVNVKSITGVSCYPTTSDADLSFALKAAANPDKVTPAITIECPSMSKDCSVKYEILGKCVATSPACPSGTDIATGFNDQAVARSSPATIPSVQFLNADKTPFTVCGATQRVDIVSASIVETNGNNVNINVKYQRDSSTLQRTVKTISDVSCYASNGTELSFAAKAPVNPDKTDAVVVVECLATNPGDCDVKHQIIAQCVDVSATCTATGIPSGSAELSVDVGTKVDLPLTTTLATTATTTALSCAADVTKRLDVKSVKIIETNAGTINVNVGYQKDATHKVSVLSASDVTCFDTGAEVRLTAAKADLNPGKTTPSITVECLSANTGNCNVKYEVLGECVAASTACTTIPTTNTAKAITLGSFVELAAADFVYENNSALVCDTTISRADIQSVKVIEVAGNLINADVKYQESATSLISVKSITNVSCFGATTAADLSFASKADANYKMANGLVRVECASTNAGDCSIKYKIVASCVLKSAAPTSAPVPTTIAPVPTTTTTTPSPTPTPTTKTTDLAASVAATTTMDYYARAIAMAVSIVAGAVMMYRRH